MKTRNLHSLFGALMVAALFAGSAYAASTNTWVGNTDANWSTAANWNFSSGSGPVANGDSLVFGAAGSAGASLNNDLSSLTVGKLTFNSGASDFTIGGSDLTLGTGGIEAGALTGGTQTIGVGITPAAGIQRWNVGAGSTLALGGLPTQFGPAGGMVIISQVGAVVTTTAGNGWDWRGPVGSRSGLIGPGMVIDNGDNTYDWAASTGSSPYTIAAATYYAAGTGDRNNVKITANTTLSLNASWASLLVSGSTFTVNGTSLYMDTGIILQAGGTINGSAPLRANADGLYIYVPDTGTIASSIQNNGANVKKLYKAGAGTLSLNGANSYTDGTWVYRGTLLVGNTSGSGTGSGAVNVSGTNTTLGGTGTISGAVTLNANTILSPGASSSAGATLTCSSDVTFSGAKAVFDLSTSAAGANDKTAVTGTLTIGSADTITINPITASTLDTTADYTLFTATTVGGSGTPALNWGTSTPSAPGTWSIVKGATNVTLHYTAPAGSPPVVGSVVFSPGSSVYTNTAVTASATVSRSPGASALSFQWQSSVNNITWANASGSSTVSNYVPNTATAGVTYYRLIATDSFGSATNAGAALTVSNPTAPTVGAPSFAPGSSVGAGSVVTATATVSANGSAITGYQWQSSANNSTWINIPGATNASYTNLNVLTSTYYRLVAMNGVGTGTGASAQLTVTAGPNFVDFGTTAPVAGGSDIAQLSSAGQANLTGAFNYYVDSSTPPGQTFTTGGNSAGYTLSEVYVAENTAGTTGGGQTTYNLRLYSISGGTATQVGSTLVSVNSGVQGTAGHWYKFGGFTPITLSANTTYAFTLQRNGGGWWSLGNGSPNPYADGEACLIPTGGGTITTESSHNYDAMFLVRLGAAPLIAAASATPDPAGIGTPVQLSVTATAAAGETISSVVVNASAIGGGSVALVSAGGNVFTNTVTVMSATAYGSPLSLPVLVTDSQGSTGSTNISLTVNHIVSTDTWVGNTDTNWSTAANWTYSVGSGPVVSGDSLVFGAAGSAGLTLNNNISGLTIGKLTFNSGADSFTFGGNDLTIGTGGIDASALSSGTETINFGITPAAGVQRWNVGSGTSLAIGGLPTQFGPSGGIVIISSTSAITTTAADGWGWRAGGDSSTPGLLGPGFVIDNGNNTYDWASVGNGNAGSAQSIFAATYSPTSNGDARNVQVTFDTTVTPNASWASLMVNGATLTHNGANLYIDTGIILENGGLIAGSGPVKANNDGLYIYTPDSGTISAKIQNNGATAKLLYKAGPGTLTLSGANTYTGNTVIYEGTLNQSTAATGAGGYVVKDGATLGVLVLSGGTLNVSSLTFGNSTNTFVGIVTNSAAITNSGALTLAGTVKVNVSGLIPVGQYPLIASASIGGTGGFALGTLPSGMVANIVTNGSTIVLNVTASAPPVMLWTGLTDGNWDFSTGGNWLSNGISAIYSDGLVTRFDDSSTQTNVYIAANVSPLSLLVSNSSRAYTFSGSAITGAGSLTKSGNGTLIFANANTYTGGTTISNGVLQLGDALSANGSVAGNIANNGTLIFANPLDQTYSGAISGTGSMIKTSYGNLTLGVNNTYAGGTVLDNYSIVTLPNGAVQAFGTGALTLSNATVYVKPGGGSSYNSANSIYLGNNVVVPAGTYSTIDNSQSAFGNLWVGGDGVQWTGSGTLTIQNSSSVVGAAVLWNGNTLANFSGTLNFGATGSGTMLFGIGYNSGNGGTGASVPTFDASGVALTLDSAGSTLCQVVDQNCTTVKFGGLSANNANTTVRGNSGSSPANQVTFEIGALNTSTYFGGKIADWGSAGTALKKVGSGTLTLAGANTYTGNTTVNGGTLEIVQPVIATNSTVSITNGAKLQLDFSETNQVAALVLNGVSQSPGVYNAANTSGYFLGTGSLMVVPPGPGGPAPIASSYNSATGQLSLTWPSGVSWRLESQTNNLSTGLSPTGWGTVTGASDGSYSVTVDRTQPTVFYRLVYP